MTAFFQTILNFINEGVEFIRLVVEFLLVVPGQAVNLTGVHIVSFFSPFILVALFTGIVKLVIKGGK